MSRSSWRAATVTFAVVIVLGAAAIAVWYSLANSHSAEDAIDARIDASQTSAMVRESQLEARIAADDKASVAACEDAVRAELKSPSTAQFAVTSNTVSGPDDDLSGSVTGTVDSQNSYGAMLRSEWKCDLAHGSTVTHPQATVTSLVQR